MSSQIIIWSALMVLLLVAFVLRMAITVCTAGGDKKIFEVTDEFELYDLTEDEA